MNIFCLDFMGFIKRITEYECIPVGCVLPALDLCGDGRGRGGGGVGRRILKFCWLDFGSQSSYFKYEI